MHIKRIGYLLRSVTPDPVRRGVARVGAFVGAGLPGDYAFPSVYRSLHLLKTLRFQSHFCIDVGAYHGEWTTLFKTVFPQSAVLMLEAQESKKGTLDNVVARFDGEVAAHIALIGPRDGDPVLFHEMETGSSVFAETSPYQRRTVTRPTSSLDTIVAQRGCPRVDFLKLDVQGYELEVLKGAPATLAQAEAVLMETSLVPINSGCPPFAEVIAFMDGSGFHLFDFCSQVRRSDGVLWQTDLLFLRAGSRFSPDPRLTKENWG